MHNFRSFLEITICSYKSIVNNKAFHSKSNELDVNKVSNFNISKVDAIFTGPPEQGRGRGGVTPSKFSVDVPFLLMSPLNVLFLKEVTKHVHENQQVKSQAS